MAQPRVDPQRHRRPDDGNPPAPDPQWAWFLDLDGTLLDIAATPRAVTVPATLPALLQVLRRRFGGALALISGRALADMEALIGPPGLPAAGQHGAELRLAAGGDVAVAARAPGLTPLGRSLRALAAAHRGVIVEDKGVSLAIHYRLSPASEPAIRALIGQQQALLADDLELREGKLVLDIRPRGADKGKAVDRLMQAPPFRGRRPLVIGDDATDRDGFAAALRQGGDALQIGPGASDLAPCWLPSPAHLRDWLGRIAATGPGDG